MKVSANNVIAMLYRFGYSDVTLLALDCIRVAVNGGYAYIGRGIKGWRCSNKEIDDICLMCVAK